MILSDNKYLNFVTQFIIFCLKLIEIIVAAIFEPYFRFKSFLIDIIIFRNSYKSFALNFRKYKASIVSYLISFSLSFHISLFLLRFAPFSKIFVVFLVQWEILYLVDRTNRTKNTWFILSNSQRQRAHTCYQ